MWVRALATVWSVRENTDLLGGPPDLGEVADHRGLIGAAAHRLPEDHRFVHTTA